jgi:transglutaminase-like putative cysteine protease
MNADAATPTPHPLAPESRELAPREFAWLLAGLAIVVAQHAVRAPWWITAATVALYGWRAASLLDRRLLPPRWLLLVVAGAVLAGVWLEFRHIFGRTPGIMLLVLFSGLKLLETRNQRDAAAVVFATWFLLMTNFLYTQSIFTAVALVAALGVSTASLVGFNAPARAARANLRTAGLLLAQAAPVALLLFLLFPRIQAPLWGLPQDAYAGLSGLGDSMSPGNISRLSLSDAIAFRVDFEGELPPRRALYWRGPVMWDFDGRTWRGGSTLIRRFAPPEGGGARHQYTVTLEPHNRTWLFALERAATLPDRSYFLSDGQIVAMGPVRARMRYEMVSVSDADPARDESVSALRRYLRLPAGFNPRATALAERWRAASSDDEQVLERAVEYFRRERLAYTLEPPLLGEHSVDEFLFQTRAGFCEHFSSAFTFLMRAAGVPARVVTGYLGGDPNPVDGRFTVRQSDAHAWSEVYLRKRGWVRVDPTALSVPGRVEAGLARAVPERETPLLLRPELQWLRSLRYQWEAITHQWNLRVLGYNTERQRELMAWVGVPRADWRDLAAALLLLLGGFVAGLVVWSLRHFARTDQVQRAWLAFCRALGERGLPRAPHEGPRNYAERASASLPAAREAIQRIAALYIALRYGAHAGAGELAELRRAVREFRRA